MLSFVKKHPWPFACALLVLVLLWLLSLPISPKFTAVSIGNADHSGVEEETTVPVRAVPGTSYPRLMFTLAMDYHAGDRTLMQIIPSDCVAAMRINGQPVTFSAEATPNICNWTTGFRIDFAPYLHDGHNTIEIESATPHGSPVKLYVYYVPQPGIPHFGSYVMIVMLLTLFALYYNRLRDHPEILLVSMAALLCFFFLDGHQDVWGYNYDKIHHIDTIDYYANYWAIPSPSLGGEMHQPPLYYATAAVLYRLLRLFSTDPNMVWYITSYNFFLMGVFLLYGIQMVLHTVQSRLLAFLAVALLMFWPGNMLHMCRITNDCMVYLTFSACAYHLLRWREGAGVKSLKLAVLWLGASFATKSTAIILLLIVALMAAYEWFGGVPAKRWWSRARAFPLRRYGLTLTLAGVFLLGCMSTGIGRNIVHVMYYPKTSLIEGRRDNSANFNFYPHQFAGLDYVEYVTYPYAFLFQPESKNYLFLNYSLKTQQYGEFSIWKGVAQASIMNMLFAGMLLYLWLYMFYRLVIFQKPAGWAGYFFTCYACCFAGSAGIMTMFNGWYLWADARHVYPIVMFFILAYANMLQLQQHDHRRLYRLGVGMMAAYIGFAIIHLSLQMTGLPPAGPAV